MELGFRIYCLLLAFFFGAAFGSFMDCLAYRLLSGESIWRGRSHCDHCGHTLGAPDLIPVFSYLLLRGKCRYCGTRVPPESFFCELLCGFLFAAYLHRFGLSFLTLRYLGFTVILLGLSLVDLKSYTIPDRFILAGILCWLFTVPLITLFGTGTMERTGDPVLAFSGLPAYLYGLPAAFQRCGLTLGGELLYSLLGALLFGGGMLGLTLLFDRITGKEGMGGGDIKLFFVCGLYVKPGCILLLLLFSCFLGLMLTALLKKKRIPFGPSIAAAAVLTTFFGPELMQAYLRLC